MTPEKQVSFIERVSKSILGLEGLQIVVYCDRTRSKTLTEEERKKSSFLEIGNSILNEIDGEFIKRKYKLGNGIEFGKKLHEERVKYMKGKRLYDMER